MLKWIHQDHPNGSYIAFLKVKKRVIDDVVDKARSELKKKKEKKICLRVHKLILKLTTPNLITYIYD